MSKIKTVGEFVDALLAAYNRDDELFFTTSAAESEFVFDNIDIEPKDEDFPETCIHLTFNATHQKEFLEAVVGEWSIDFREDLLAVIQKYL